MACLSSVPRSRNERALGNYAGAYSNAFIGFRSEFTGRFELQKRMEAGEALEHFQKEALWHGKKVI
jgi:hypothetical protein